jgi:hypothetical protein
MSNIKIQNTFKTYQEQKKYLKEIISNKDDNINRVFSRYKKFYLLNFLSYSSLL